MFSALKSLGGVSLSPSAWPGSQKSSCCREMRWRLRGQEVPCSLAPQSLQPPLSLWSLLTSGSSQGKAMALIPRGIPRGLGVIWKQALFCGAAGTVARSTTPSTCTNKGENHYPSLFLFFSHSPKDFCD